MTEAGTDFDADNLAIGPWDIPATDERRRDSITVVGLRSISAELVPRVRPVKRCVTRKSRDGHSRLLSILKFSPVILRPYRDAAYRGLAAVDLGRPAKEIVDDNTSRPRFMLSRPMRVPSAARPTRMFDS
jgi:hypothetical protein